MWSAVQFSLVRITPHMGQLVPMAAVTTWSRARLYCAPYACRTACVLGAHRVGARRGRGLVAC
jgi:hypothetical protein